jgi:membrane protein
MSKAIDFLLDTFYLDRVTGLFKATFNEWMEDNAPQLGAALAYYTVFSLAPLLLVLISVFSLVVGKNNAQAQVKQQMSQFMDKNGAEVVGSIVKTNAEKPKAGIIGTVVGVALGLFGASGVFGQLQDALNTIWGVKAKPGLGIMGYLKARFISFGMVGGVFFLLLVSMTVSALISGFHHYLDKAMPGGATLITIASLLINMVVITALFAMIFKFLPDAKIAWRDVWTGAALTTVLFIVGKWALGLYLGSSNAGSAYGAAGALISTLVWVYYSAQILLFGAEFTQVYANQYGSHIEPEDHAVRVKVKEVELPPSGDKKPQT